MKKRPGIDELAEGILRGDRVVLARAVTLIESNREQDREQAYHLLDQLSPHTGNSIRVGISGVPGVGKSTFIDAFAAFLIKEHDARVAVLAIDPSSSISKGSILGDKTRMQELSSMEQAFIRPSPSQGNLGGITSTTRETMLLCEAAGFDHIFIETVGVGQSEVSVRGIVDFFLLLMLAGAGDELQGIKRGIMELCDSLVINKADGENEAAALRAASEYRHALHLLRSPESGWQPKVGICSAIEKKGLGEIYDSIKEYADLTKKNGYFERNREEQQEAWFRTEIMHQIFLQLESDPFVKNHLEKALSEVRKGTINPVLSARRLTDQILKR